MSEMVMDLTATRVRKWGRLKMGLSLYGDAAVTVPEDAADLFDAVTNKPKAWPAGVREMGFITTSGVVDANCASFVIQDAEQGFLMGALSALLTQSKTVGFIGGLEIQPIKNGGQGFAQFVQGF